MSRMSVLSLGPALEGHDDDAAVLAHAQAPPELAEGVDALAYWRARHRDLPWFRRSARREAERMMVAWEGRVGRAVALQADAPWRDRAGAAVLVARSGGCRLARRWAWRIQSRLLALAAAGGAAFALVDAIL